MAGLTINLLPAQFRVDQKAQKKFQIIQKSSIAALMLFIFLASSITAFRILKSQEVSRLETQVKQEEEKVLSKKTSETILVVLKNRLSLINQIEKSGSNNTLIFQQISSLIPAEIQISTLSVDRSGNMAIAIVAPGTQSLERMIASLTSKEAFELISKVELESLSRGREGNFRSNLKITAGKQ